MSELPNLEGASCLDLPPQVFEKYFNADYRTFLGKTAVRICAQCPAYQACMQQALMCPPETGIQAGQPARVWRETAADMMRSEGMVDVRYLPDELLHPQVEPVAIHNKRPQPIPGQRYPARKEASHAINR